MRGNESQSEFAFGGGVGFFYSISNLPIQLGLGDRREHAYRENVAFSFA